MKPLFSLLKPLWAVVIVVLCDAPAAGDSRYPVGTRQVDLSHRGRLDRECGQVLALEVMHVRFAARARDRSQLHHHHLQVVAHPTRAFFRIEPQLQLGILVRDADRASSGVAVMAKAGRGPESLVVGDDFPMLAAVGAPRAVTPRRGHRALAYR